VCWQSSWVNSKLQFIKLREQLIAYNCGEYRYESPACLDGFKLATWWKQRSGDVAELKKMATLLAEIVTHSASPERVFSLMGWYHSEVRNRLCMHMVKCMAAIKMDQQAR
jgi:hAT family C-terminal dimerisation region